jgi:hypothetical protein
MLRRRLSPSDRENSSYQTSKPWARSPSANGRHRTSAPGARMAVRRGGHRLPRERWRFAHAVGTWAVVESAPLRVVAITWPAGDPRCCGAVECSEPSTRATAPANLRCPGRSFRGLTSQTAQLAQSVTSAWQDGARAVAS